MYKNQIWSPEEVELLNKHWKEYDQRELKEKFFPNKTIEQVRNKKMYAGLKGRRIWSEEERNLLLEHGSSHSNREMAEKFLPNKTRAQINSYRRGLVKNWGHLI